MATEREKLDAIKKMAEIMGYSGGFTVLPQWAMATAGSNGRPVFARVAILAEIAYWYTPVAEIDGNMTRWRARFNGDMLQLNYKQVAARWGLTRRQVSDAVSWLVDAGIIRRELRVVKINGQQVGNIPFVEPVPEKFAQVSAGGWAEIPNANMGNLTPSHVPTCKVSRSNVQGITFQREDTVNNKVKSNNSAQKAREGATSPLGAERDEQKSVAVPRGASSGAAVRSMTPDERRRHLAALMAEGEKNAEISAALGNWRVPADIDRAIAAAFVEKYRQPTRSERATWVKGLRQWADLARVYGVKLQPRHIEEAWRYALERGTEVVRPQGLNYALDAILRHETGKDSPVEADRIVTPLDDTSGFEDFDL